MIRSMLALVALTVAAQAQTYVATCSASSPSFTIPAYNPALGPLLTVTVTIQTDLTRSYTATNLDTLNPSSVMFNAPASWQSTEIYGPDGDVLASVTAPVAPTTFVVPAGLTMSASDSYTYFAFPTVTDVTKPRVYQRSAGVTFTAGFAGSYNTTQLYGACSVVESTDVPTIVTVTYN